MDLMSFDVGDLNICTEALRGALFHSVVSIG